jgi:hypothetical protein
MKPSTLAALAALASLCSTILPSTLAAQVPVSLSGTVQRLATPGCDPNATHGIQCSDVLLTGAGVDLTALEGRVVALSGSLDLASGCPSIAVTEAVPASVRTAHFALRGTRLGQSVTFTTIAPAGSIVAHIFGCSRGFLPLGPLGSVLIGVQDAVFVGTGISFGLDLRTERIPNDPSLVDVEIYYQFGYVSITTGFEAGFLNVGCFRIRE